MFWLAINSWSGGQFVQLMIIAIWPSYARLPNAVPASQGATTSDFLSFFIFWVIQLPFIFIHPSKLKLVFNIKAAVVPVVAIGTLIWVSTRYQFPRSPGTSDRGIVAVMQFTHLSLLSLFP